MDLEDIRTFNNMSIQEVAEYYDNHYEYSEIHICEDDCLVELVTNEYSDNEDFIWRLNMFTRHRNAYVGQLKAGKHYYDITGSTDGATYMIMKFIPVELNNGDDK